MFRFVKEAHNHTVPRPTHAITLNAVLNWYKQLKYAKAASYLLSMLRPHTTYTNIYYRRQVHETRKFLWVTDMAAFILLWNHMQISCNRPDCTWVDSDKIWILCAFSSRSLLGVLKFNQVLHLYVGKEKKKKRKKRIFYTCKLRYSYLNRSFKSFKLCYRTM